MCRLAKDVDFRRTPGTAHHREELLNQLSRRTGAHLAAAEREAALAGVDGLGIGAEGVHLSLPFDWLVGELVSPRLGWAAFLPTSAGIILDCDDRGQLRWDPAGPTAAASFG
jgi:hypothetical protein